MTKSVKCGSAICFYFKTVALAVAFFNNSTAEGGKSKLLCIKTLSVTILI